MRSRIKEGIVVAFIWITFFTGLLIADLPGFVRKAHFTLVRAGVALLGGEIR